MFHTSSTRHMTSLASHGSRFGPGVVFRGRGLGPGVVSGVFFSRPGRAPRLWRVSARNSRLSRLGGV
jgi:hypothetical protein